MERCAVAVLLVLGGLAPAIGQEKAAADLKDPSAVALAYARACRAGDDKALLDLLAPGDPGRAMVTQMVKSMSQDMARTGYASGDILTEFTLLPLAFRLDQSVTDAKQQGEEARVTLHVTAALDQKLVLARQPDGTWRVKLFDSLRASTSTGKSMFASDMGGGGGGPTDYESQNHLRMLYQALEEYTGEHNGQLPPADHWMDALTLFVLDPTQFQCPAAPQLECGYAMNEELSQRPLGDDMNARRDTLVLFEWPSGTRNAHTKPADLAGAKSLRSDGAVMVLTGDGQTVALAPGTSLAEKREADQQTTTCSEHLTALATAARRYARQHGGVLPSAKSWQADLAPFVTDKEGPDLVLTCPAVPDLKHAYAINAEVAGRNVLELKNPENLILFFESDLNVPNAAGAYPKDAPAQPRHIGTWSMGPGKVHCVAYVGGSASQVPPEAPPVAEGKPAEGGKPAGAGQ